LFLGCGGSPASSGTTTTSGDPTSGSETSQSDSAADTQADSGPATDSDPNEFKTKLSTTAGTAHGVSESKIKATPTHSAMKFFVVDKGKNVPIPGVVISLQGPDGQKYYTEETDALGYGEVLVPAGASYDLVYLTLGQEDITAKVKVADEPNQNIKLTLRYKPRAPKPAAVPVPEPGKPAVAPPEPVFRLDGVNFNTGSSVILAESFPRLDAVVEYMEHKKSSRIEISGHTDNVGNAAKNKALSQKRAQACRTYFIEHGIDGSRIEAVGYGDQNPAASNNTEAGRRENRRIEAKEL